MLTDACAAGNDSQPDQPEVPETAQFDIPFDGNIKGFPNWMVRRIPDGVGDL